MPLQFLSSLALTGWWQQRSSVGGRRPRGRTAGRTGVTVRSLPLGEARPGVAVLPALRACSRCTTASGVTDRVFGVTEQAEAMELLRETHPDFVQEDFLQYINDELGPSVIGAYLKGEVEVLQQACREQALATLKASVNERTERKLLMDPRILFMSEPELESIRIIGGLPTVIVAFETHQVYCLRSLSNGAIVEGSEDDIRAFHYLWALQPNLEESESELPWQVTELAIRGVLETCESRRRRRGLPSSCAAGHEESEEDVGCRRHARRARAWRVRRAWTVWQRARRARRVRAGGLADLAPELESSTCGCAQAALMSAESCMARQTCGDSAVFGLVRVYLL